MTTTQQPDYDYPKIRQEFPDYPVDSIPANIPAWLTSSPRRNEAMPIWGDEGYLGGGDGIALAIDYPDPGRRENGPDALRFFVFGVKNGDFAEGFSSDDWEATLAELDRRRDEVNPAVVRAEIDPPLLIATMPTGLAYCDRRVERGGDYLRVAFLPFSSLEVEWGPGRCADLRARIEAHAATITARRGERFTVSTCGQTVLLGEG